MIGTVLLLLLSGTDPCAPVAADLPPDPATAALYRDVAGSEDLAGDGDAAAAAYREVLRRDPDDGASRTALAGLCRRSRAARRFEEGLDRMQARAWAGAATAFAEARAGGAGAAAALLEGVARFELGEDDLAAVALAEAALDPRLRDAARLHQGLLALRKGSPARAVEAFEDASGPGALSPLAAQLSRQARLSGRLVVIAALDAGRDSNPALLDRDPTADATASVGLSALVRPLGRWGPYLRASGQLRRYDALGDLDLSGLDAAAGLQLGRDAAGALAEYGLVLRRLGGEPYLTAHRALASGWVATGPVLWSAVALARLERFAADWDPLSGVLLRGELRAGIPLGRAVLAGLSYGAARDWTDTAALSFGEHGPRADLQILLGPRLVLLADAGAAWRSADAFDPVLGATRRDLTLDGSLTLEWDLRHGLLLRGAVSGRRARSTVDAYSHDAWMPSLGLRYVFGR
jgi:hypothetical protein